MATIDDGDPYTSGLTGAFATAFEDLGGNVTSVASISRGDQDMLPVLTQVAAANPDGLYFPVFEDEGAYIVQQLGQVAGLEGLTLVGGEAMPTPEFLAMPESEGIFFPKPRTRLREQHQ